MKFLNRQADNFSLTGGKAAFAFAMLAAISLLFMPPAFAEHGGGHGGGEHGGGHGGWHGGGGGGWRGGGYGGGYGYAYPYGYAQPVYAPPVYYPPQAGVSVMFPLNVLIR